jgi:4-alpha-glucanotransferase
MERIGPKRNAAALNIKMELEGKLFSSSFGEQWKKIGVYPRHGINLPLSALHSNQSCGIGEFLDLILLVDWCKQIGFDVIQLLPLTDTGDDPSPYFSLSSCALNPLFLSLRQLPHLQPSALLGELSAFNKTERIAFHEVQSRKLVFLRRYFEEIGPLLVSEKEYQIFLSKEPWLESYALFKTLKEKITKNHWLTWPTELQHPSAELRRELLERYHHEVTFHCVLQYLAANQLMRVKNYANSREILLMGDLPFLISPDSCDVWENLDEFDLELSVGAPPDLYNREGQLWGFPLLRWETMESKQHQWWQLRLHYASHFYDLIRIDHVLGFFRIWAIPIGCSSSEGYYLPADPTSWIPHGKKLLTMIAKYSPMLPIAEDLGTSFQGMRETLEELGLCGTKVLRWERHWESDESFIPPRKYNPLSLTTVSTHDSETLALWWRDLPQEAIRYAAQKGWHYQSTLFNKERLAILQESHASSSLFHINLLSEYLALFPQFVSEDPSQERINIPGTLLPTNWTYRIRPNIEEFSAYRPLIDVMQKLCKQ